MRTLVVASVAVLSMSSGHISPAHAQDPLTRFLDGIFGQQSGPRQSPSRQPAPVQPAPAEAPPPPPARGAAPQRGAPAPLPVGQPAPQAQPAQPVQARVHPLPPPRPPGIGGAAVAQVAAVPATAPAAEPVQVAQPARAPQPAAMPRNASEAVARVNAYLNGINTLTARFVQTGADRQKVGGTLYVQRPGRLRFAYDPPSTLEIVADGRSVAVRDSRLRTNDVYSIGQTPLKFLLRDNVDLARDVRVRNVDIDPGGLIALSLEDSATLGGTSRVTLHFDARANVLRGWAIVDPQGYETTIALSGVEVARR
ncbi:outer-membrane lipoprotein carrier protein LolA [Pseudochelatococcus sp. B33]